MDNKIQNTKQPAKPFFKPMVVDCGKAAQLTNGLPDEILDEYYDYFCIASVNSLRPRD
jgi:hypothetical protein